MNDQQQTLHPEIELSMLEQTIREKRKEFLKAQKKLHDLQDKIQPAMLEREKQIQAINDQFELANAEVIKAIDDLLDESTSLEEGMREAAIDVYLKRNDPDNKKVMPGLGVMVRNKPMLTVEPNDADLLAYVKTNYPKFIVVDEKKYLAQYKLDEELPHIKVETSVSAVVKKEFWEDEEIPA